MKNVDHDALFAAAPDQYLVLAPEPPRYPIVAVSDAYCRATRQERENMLGRGLFEVFPDNPDEEGATGTTNLAASLKRAIESKAPDTMAIQKYDVPLADGTFETHYWSVKNIPVLQNGEVTYLLHRAEDVTAIVAASEQGDRLKQEIVARSAELHASNEKLREMNSKLGELDKAKTLFFSNISHEFRTPLTLMLGPLEDSLADTTLGEEQRHRLEMAHDNALRLLKLVNSLLDFARLESGRLQARFAATDFSALVYKLGGMFETAAHRAGLGLVIDAPPLGEPLWVDVELWDKILPNLLSNALKFTHQGTITVTLRDHADHVTLDVTDTGVGIPASQLTKVFERFHRVAETTGRTYEGSGIGLSLVQELVHLHRGEVSVTSEQGKGSTFRIRLKKGKDHLPATDISDRVAEGSSSHAYAVEAKRWTEKVVAPAKAAANAPRVMIVDDNADLRDYIGGLLAPLYQVSFAVDGEDALRRARENPPDLVLSDVMMPKLDGIGLATALRKEKAFAAIPIILLSARAGTDASIDGLDSGADDYLTKPFTARELLARVRTHLHLARVRREWIAELERANHDLDAFSYSVSHDLRAPLRAIAGFSEALVEDLGEKLDGESARHLTRIIDGAQRMGQLIEALLELARIARSPLVQAEVDLSQLAAEVIDDLRAGAPERKVQVHIAKGLVTRGDRALLQVVLMNLLGNAWKFTSKTEVPRIDVDKLEDGTLFVRDNGAGFDMRYAARLFSPFSRFHRPDEFAGTGIGLASVQRAVTRHGGKVWAEAAEGKGATFYFALPR